MKSKPVFILVGHPDNDHNSEFSFKHPQAQVAGDKAMKFFEDFIQRDS